MNASKEQDRLAQVLTALSSPPFTKRRMQAREYVCKALAELESEYWETVKANENVEKTND